MIRRQVVTNKTDAIVAVVVTDARGYFEAPHTEDPLVLSFDKNVIVRFGVGREVFDSHYDGSGSVVVKDDHIELGVIPLRYVTETIGSQTLYRLPRFTDDMDVNTLPVGNFLCFKVHVPRGTFDTTGAMKVAICHIKPDTHFEDSIQKVWSKFGDTSIIYSEI